jgi:hypothetical protein
MFSNALVLVPVDMTRLNIQIMRLSEKFVLCVFIAICGLISVPLFAATNNGLALFVDYLFESSVIEDKPFESLKIEKRSPIFFATLKRLVKSHYTSHFYEAFDVALKTLNCHISHEVVVSIFNKFESTKYVVRGTKSQTNYDYYYTFPIDVGSCGLYAVYNLKISRTGVPKSGSESLLFFEDNGGNFKLALSKILLHFD